MPGVIAVRAVFGQDEANHGTTRFRVGPDRVVVVPQEAAEPLLKRGGFARVGVAATPTLAIAACPLAPALLVPLRHKTAQGCSYNGSDYRADPSGVVRVPAEAVAELAGHGFMSVEASFSISGWGDFDNPDGGC